MRSESKKNNQVINIFTLFCIEFQSCIIAIVVPEVDVIKSWAQENGISGTLSVLCANPEVKKLIMDDMTAWGKDAGLKSFEQVRHTQRSESSFLSKRNWL